MNITYILPEIIGGGIATYYKNLIQPIIDSGNTVNVILADYQLDISKYSFPGNLLQISENDYKDGLARYKALDIFPSIRHKCALSYACYEKAKLLQSQVIEITDYNLLFYCFLTKKIAPILVRLAGSSGQLELHEMRDSNHIESVFLLGLEKTLINQADYIVGLSSLNVEYWNKNLTKRAFVHLPYANYSEGVFPSSSKTERGVVIGRLQTWKGAIFLCEFYRKYPDCPSVDWIGGDNYYKNYSNSMFNYLTKEYDDVMGKKIHFVGRLPYEETQRRIAEAEFVLIPSIWDTFNFVATEAMWKKKIVIGSDGAGSTELIEDSHSGFKFKKNDLSSLRSAFLRFQSKSTQDLAFIQENAHSTIHQRMNCKSIIVNRLDIYKELIRNKTDHSTEEVNFINMSFENISSLNSMPLRRVSLRNLLLRVIKKLFL